MRRTWWLTFLFLPIGNWAVKSSKKVVHIVSPTESLITQRGKRHPNLASFLVKNGIDVNYITSTINHADKRLFSRDEILEGRNAAPYPICFLSSGIYKKNISLARV